MLSEKQIKKKLLTVIKTSDVKVVRMNTAKPVTPLKKEGAGLRPPLDVFNTGYLKAKDHDPL